MLIDSQANGQWIGCKGGLVEKAHGSQSMVWVYRGMGWKLANGSWLLVNGLDVKEDWLKIGWLMAHSQWLGCIEDWMKIG